MLKKQYNIKVNKKNKKMKKKKIDINNQTSVSNKENVKS